MNTHVPGLASPASRTSSATSTAQTGMCVTPGVSAIRRPFDPYTSGVTRVGICSPRMLVSCAHGQYVRPRKVTGTTARQKLRPTCVGLTTVPMTSPG